MKSAARSIGGLIRLAFGGSPGKLTEDDILPPMGTENWYEALREKNVVLKEPEPPVPLGPAIPRRRRVTPSSLAKAEDMETREAVEPGKSTHANFGELTAAEFGTLVHAAWEEIIWLDATKPDWVSAPQSDAQQIVADALRQPEIAALFTPQSGQEVYNEQAIEAITDEDEWLSGTIDRLVLTTDAAGKVTAAHIIDYKTNRLDPTQEKSYETLKKEYSAQMEAYRKHVSAALGIPESAVAVSLLSCPRGVKARIVPC